MSTIARARELVAILQAADINAGTDPAGIIPPAVLIPPPSRVTDLFCGYSATWRPVLLAPGTAGSDAGWVQLDELLDSVSAALTAAGLSWETVEPIAYTLAAGQAPLPAYQLTLNPEGMDT